MWTMLYKGFAINGYIGKDACTIWAGEVKGQGYVWECKSLRAAKLKITRMIKDGTKPPDL